MPLCLHRHAPTAEGLASAARAAQSKQKTNRTKPHIRKSQVRMCRHRSLRARRDPKPEISASDLTAADQRIFEAAHINGIDGNCWKLPRLFCVCAQGHWYEARLARRRHELVFARMSSRRQQAN
jgi:hypothetical protein